MNRETQDNLSPRGQLRRDAMLGELVGAMARLHRVRRIRRRALSATAAILFVIGVFRLTVGPETSRVVKLGTEVAPTAPASPPSPVKVQYVQTDPGAASRFRAEPQSLIVRIDDAQLVQTLIEIGRPAGLIRIGERVALSAPVTDEELHIPQ